MDWIALKNAHYSANLGITKKEKQFVQPVIMDIKLLVGSISNAAKSDDIKNTINYSEINKAIQRLLDEKEFKLIETLAETVADLILDKFPVIEVGLVVKKPQALKNVEYTSVAIHRRAPRFASRAE